MRTQGLVTAGIHPEERRWCSQNPEAGVQLDQGDSEPSGPIPYKDLGRQLLATSANPHREMKMLGLRALSHVPKVK